MFPTEIKTLSKYIVSLNHSTFLALTDAEIGFDAQDRGQYDTDRLRTYVDDVAFSAAGTIRSISMHAGHDDRPLRVGIYRHEGAACNYRLVEQIFFHSVPSGVNTVDITVFRRVSRL